jgi:hypothetical protein
MGACRTPAATEEPYFFATHDLLARLDQALLQMAKNSGIPETVRDAHDPSEATLPTTLDDYAIGGREYGSTPPRRYVETSVQCPPAGEGILPRSKTVG